MMREYNQSLIKPSMADFGEGLEASEPKDMNFLSYPKT